MKRKDISFDSMCSFESLLSAYKRARRANPNSRSTLVFGWQLEKNIIELSSELMNGRYQHGLYHEFIVVDAKKRNIKAAPFKDRIVHQALCAAIEPVFERRFIGDSYACRSGKGTHNALFKLESWLRRSDDCYVLSCDISKYFASINHSTLLYIISSRVSDVRLVNLCRLIIGSSEDSPNHGIPIGNLTSQLFANIYLDVLDNYVKRSLGIKHYIRYMDDFLIFGTNKKTLHEVKAGIAEFLDARLDLALHPKKANIYPVSGGVPFLGYHVFRYHRALRKDTVMRFTRRVRKQKPLVDSGVMDIEEFSAGLQSWSAYASYATSRGLMHSLSRRLSISFPLGKQCSNKILENSCVKV